MKLFFPTTLTLLLLQSTLANAGDLQEVCSNLAYSASNVKHRIAREKPELFSQCNELNFIQLKVSTKARSSQEKKQLMNGILNSQALKGINYRVVTELSENEDKMAIEAMFDSANTSCSVKIELKAGGASINYPASKSRWGMTASDCVKFVEQALTSATEWATLPIKLQLPSTKN